MKPRHTDGMEITALLEAFPGSHLICKVCGQTANDAYCDGCIRLTQKQTGRPIKWTECDKCGTHYLGVHTSKKCLMTPCDGKRVICEVQPTQPKKDKPKKTRREKVAA